MECFIYGSSVRCGNTIGFGVGGGGGSGVGSANKKYWD